ncbi:MAG TPA: DUF2235 domain-containing protein [Terriglobales bacterium]|nr:DUF2235 domain-containing protein [Terriglobales bacterium]
MAKNIVICCDGTGNEFAADDNSNVVKLYSTLQIDDKQVAFYHPGVGTMGSPAALTWAEKYWTKVLGLAFGRGLLEDVSLAYEFLMEKYEDGDSIYLFGFSRGAYTARAVAAVLHMYGLLYSGNESLIAYMLRMFARRTRQQGNIHQTFEVAHEFKGTFSRDCLIHFVGVWDTVSSVGWIYDPVVLPYTARNPIMQIGRHAISIDEHRCFFQNNLWGRPFINGDDQYRVDQNIKQVWFAGVHSDVGGSYPELESGLSKIALEWMLAESSQAGLLISQKKAEKVLGYSGGPCAKPDPAACQHESLRGPWWAVEFLPYRYYDFDTREYRYRIPRGAHRTIPEGSTLHETVIDRMTLVPEYRPTNLPKSYQIEPWVKFPLGAAANP